MGYLRGLKTRPLAIGICVVLLGIGTHAASIAVFTDRARFVEAVGVPQFAFNFTGVPDGAGPLVLDGLTVTGDFAIDGGAMNFATPGPTASSVWTFGRDIYAFGMDVDPLSGPLVVDVAGANGPLQAAFNITTPGFIGFVSDFPFRAFNLTAGPPTGEGSVQFLVDNVIAQAVPAPPTIVLLLSGAAMFHLVARGARRRRARPDAPPRPARDDHPV